MKRNNKALYEQIMRNVSKQVKKALNENNSNNLGFFDFIPELMVFMEQDNDRVDEEEKGVNIIYYFTKNYLSKYLNIDDEVLGKQFKNAIQSGINALDKNKNYKYFKQLEKIIYRRFKDDQFYTYIDSDGLHIEGNEDEGYELLNNYRGFEVEQLVIKLQDGQFTITVVPSDDNVNMKYYDELQSIHGSVDDLSDFIDSIFYELDNGAEDIATKIGFYN